MVAATVCLPLGASAAQATYDNRWRTPGWGTDRPDVIGDCDGDDGGTRPDQCTYHEVTAWTQLGKRHQASNVVSNCASNTSLTYAVTYLWSTNSSYSATTGQTLEVSVGLEDVFTGGITASQTSSETWTLGRTATTSNTITATIPAGYSGAYWFAPYVHHSQGWLEVHYPKRLDGHYIWYYPYIGGTGIDIATPVLWSNGQIKGQLYWATWRC